MSIRYDLNYGDLYGKGHVGNFELKLAILALFPKINSVSIDVSN
jgi:hypothetical protein